MLESFLEITATAMSATAAAIATPKARTTERREGRFVEPGFVAAISRDSLPTALPPRSERVTPAVTPPDEWPSLERGSSFVPMIDLATERKTTPITPRQREVVALIAAGCSNDEAGLRLGISPRTVKAHCDVLRQKLGVQRRRQIPIAFRLLTGEDPLSAGRRHLLAARLPR